MALIAERIDRPAERAPTAEGMSVVRVAAVGAALLAIAVYANTLRHGFVPEDVPFLTFARTGHGILDWRHFFLEAGVPERNGAATYRPVTLWSFALVDALGGTGPVGQHLANVLLHAAGSAILVLALAATGVPAGAAAFGGVLFAVHPIHTEAVAHVASRGDVLAGGLAFLAVLAWLAALAGRRVSLNVVVALAAFALAGLASEQAVPLVLLLPLADVLVPRTPGVRRAGRRLVFYGIAVGLAAGYVVLRRAALAGAPAPDDSVVFQANPVALAAPPVRVLTALRVLALAVSLLFAPFHLSASYAFRHLVPVESVSDPGALAGLAAGAGLVVLGVVLWLRSRPAFFWLLFAVVLYGVVSNIPFASASLFREDRLYLPSAGFCALVALILVRPAGARLQIVGVAIAAVLVVAGAILTVRRNPVWRDESTLAQATVEAAPESAQAHRMLGSADVAAGRDDEALQEFQRALSIYPGDKSSLYNVGVVLQRHDKPIEALTVFRRLADLDPGFAPAWINIAAINNTQLAFTPALDAADRAIAVRPDIPNAHIVRGFALRGMTRFAEARAAFEEALRLAPEHPEALLGLGATAVDLADWNLGAGAFRRLIAVAPVADAYRGLVFCLRQAGRTADAAEAARTAHEKFPEDPFFTETPAE